MSQSVLFPIDDLIPEICQYLDIDDIRALMINHYTRDQLTPFIYENVTTYDEYGTKWFEIKLPRLTNYSKIIFENINNWTVIPRSVSNVYTGIIQISYGGVHYFMYSQRGVVGYSIILNGDRLDIRVLNPIHFLAYYKILMISYYLRSDYAGGYPTDSTLHRAVLNAYNSSGHGRMFDYIYSDEFIALISTWKRY